MTSVHPKNSYPLKMPPSQVLYELSTGIHAAVRSGYSCRPGVAVAACNG